MAIVSAHKSDIGRKYTQNDDYVWVDKKTGLYILADGMGGHEAGDIASELAATTAGPFIIKQLHTQTRPLSVTAIRAVMVEALEIANQTVLEMAQKAQQKRRMGTTVVVALIHNTHVYISHAGDSRAYLVRDATMKQLTEDDSFGAQFAMANPDKDKSSRGRFDHFLTKSVGQETQLDPSFLDLELTPDDWLLLCSDGLWNMVPEQEILASLDAAGNDPAQAVETLVTAANAAGGKDNISVVAIKFIP